MDEITKQNSGLIKNIHVVSVGPFGRAAARQLKTFCPNIVEMEWSENCRIDQESWPESDVQVITSWRMVPSLCRYLDEISHKRTRPLIPLVVEFPTLCLGPIIIPGESGCWHCWEQRVQQHTKFRPERSALVQFYEENLDVGPNGYLEPFALIAAAQIANIIRSNKTLQQVAGHSWQLDLFTREVSTGFLVGVDGCPRCGLNRPLSTRTYAEMSTALGFLRNTN